MSSVDEAIRIDHTEVFRNGVAESESRVCLRVVGYANPKPRSRKESLSVNPTTLPRLQGD